MLQQTQVDRVVPHYERFVAAFATPGGLRPGTPRRGGPAVVGPRVQPAGAATCTGRRHGRRRARRRGARRIDALRALAGRRALHGAGRPFVRLRGRRGGGGHQRRAGAVALRGGRPAHGRRGDPAGRPARARRGCRGSSTRPCSTSGRPCARARAPTAPGCPLRRQCAWRRGGATGPDPWRTGPTARRQSPFAGSDRQGRGRLLHALAGRRRGAGRAWPPPAAGRTTPAAPSWSRRRW